MGGASWRGTGSGQGRYEIQTRYYSGGTPHCLGVHGHQAIPQTLSHMGRRDVGHRPHLRVASPHLRRRHLGRPIALVCDGRHSKPEPRLCPPSPPPIEGGTWTEATPGADVAGTWFAITYVLYAADGRPIMSSTLSRVAPPPLEDATGYRIGVRVKSITSPVWSVEIVRAFTVELARPAAPTVTTAWDANVASCTLTVTNPASTPPAIYNEVRRGGALIGRCPINGTFTDWLPTPRHPHLPGVGRIGATVPHHHQRHDHSRPGVHHPDHPRQSEPRTSPVASSTSKTRTGPWSYGNTTAALILSPPGMRDKTPPGR